MTRRFRGKTVFVTGGASGIGRATARRFVAEDARVIIADINEEQARTIAAELGGNAMAMRVDVSSEPAWEQAMQDTLAWAGRLDIMCNIAGIGRGGNIEEITLEDWNAMIAVNLTGTMLGCKHGVRTIASSGGNGAIINMSSIGGLVGPADIAGYNATKGGVTILTKSVALHCAQRRYPIRCVSIHPTYVDSEMLDPVAAAAGVTRQSLTAAMAQQVPIGRVATPDDVASAVLFAASDEASMISGSGIIVDGAQLAGPPGAHF